MKNSDQLSRTNVVQVEEVSLGSGGKKSMKHKYTQKNKNPSVDEDGVAIFFRLRECARGIVAHAYLTMSKIFALC